MNFNLLQIKNGVRMIKLVKEMKRHNFRAYEEQTNCLLCDELSRMEKKKGLAASNLCPKSSAPGTHTQIHRRFVRRFY